MQADGSVGPWIAADSPKGDKEVKDFYNLIWKSDAPVVVMLCNAEEEGQVGKYYPIK